MAGAAISIAAPVSFWVMGGSASALAVTAFARLLSKMQHLPTQ